MNISSNLIHISSLRSLKRKEIQNSTLFALQIGCEIYPFFAQLRERLFGEIVFLIIANFASLFGEIRYFKL